MGYAEYLLEMIRPLGVYAEGGFAEAELVSLGAELDAADAGAFELERESVPLTADSWGLELYEKLLPFVPVWHDTEGRRSALIALIGMYGGGCTLAQVNRALAGCGVAALAEETDSTQSVRISFPSVIGVPENFEALCTRIESILPCHLEPVYFFLNTSWDRLESGGWTWDALESEVTDWNDMESRLI